MMSSIQLPKVKHQSTEGVLVGLCNALLDISAHVSLEYLDHHGLKPNSISMSDSADIAVEVCKLFPVTFTAGGSGQNTMRGAQYLLPENSVIYFGCVGCDEFANILQNFCDANGLKACYMRDPSKPTGTCATLITDNGSCRSLVANLAAATNFNESHLSTPENRSIIQKAQVYYVTGFMVAVSVPSILLLAQHALENDKIFCMNLSAPFVSQVFGKDLEKVYPYTDIVFGNRSEAEAFAKYLGLDSSLNISEIAMAMARLSKMDHPNKTFKKRIVIITHDEDPVTVSDGTVVETFPVPEVPKSLIVDTNGAGDSFVAGFLAEMIQNKSLKEALAKGMSLSALIIQTIGVVYPSKDKNL